MLRVWLRGTHVGDLRLHDGGRWVFRFTSSYVRLPQRPVLGRWFEDKDLAALDYTAPLGRLPAFFQNYLPEEGSALRELLARKAQVEPRLHGPLLAALGEDLPGAVTVREVDDELERFEEAPLPQDAPVLPAQALRFSLAGMQLKFSVMRDADKWTLPVTGRGGRWIAKLPDRAHPRVPEHERAMLSLAERVGIRVPEHDVVPWRDITGLPDELDFDEPYAFLCRRYDRGDGGERIHQEDFAQVFDRQPDNKHNDYPGDRLAATFESIGRVVMAVCGPDDFVEYVRRLAFMVLIGNHDAHLKNWSLYYPDPRHARLAPAYDLLSTVVYIPRQSELALRFFKKKHFGDVLRSDFERLAEKANADVSRVLGAVDETLGRFHDAWRLEGPHLPLSEASRATLERHLASLALRRA